MYVYVVLLTKEKRYDLNELILDIAHFKLTTGASKILTQERQKY